MVETTGSEQDNFYSNTFDDFDTTTNDMNVMFGAPLLGILEENTDSEIVDATNEHTPTGISNELDTNISVNFDLFANDLSANNYDGVNTINTSVNYDSEAIENDLSAATFDYETIENSLTKTLDENATDEVNDFKVEITSDNDCNKVKKDPSNTDLLEDVIHFVDNDKDNTNSNILTSFIDDCTERKTATNEIEAVGVRFVDQQILEEVNHADAIISSEKNPRDKTNQRAVEVKKSTEEKNRFKLSLILEENEVDDFPVEDIKKEKSENVPNEEKDATEHSNDDHYMVEIKRDIHDEIINDVKPLAAVGNKSDIAGANANDVHDDNANVNQDLNENQANLANKDYNATEETAQKVNTENLNSQAHDNQETENEDFYFYLPKDKIIKKSSKITEDKSDETASNDNSENTVTKSNDISKDGNKPNLTPTKKDNSKGMEDCDDSVAKTDSYYLDKLTKTKENDHNEDADSENVATDDELKFSNLDSEFKYILSKVNSEEESSKLMKKILLISVSNTLFIRGFLSERHYHEAASIGRANIRVLRKPDTNDTNLSTILEGAFEAIEKKFLKDFILVFYTDEEDPLESVHEFYKFSFRYHGKDKYISIKTQDLESRVVYKLEHFICRLNSSLEQLGPLPDQCYMKALLTYHPCTPDHYDPPSFQPSFIQDFLVEDNEIELSGPTTMHHGLTAGWMPRSKIRSGNVTMAEEGADAFFTNGEYKLCVVENLEDFSYEEEMQGESDFAGESENQECNEEKIKKRLELFSAYSPLDMNKVNRELQLDLDDMVNDEALADSVDESLSATLDYDDIEDADISQQDIMSDIINNYVRNQAPRDSTDETSSRSSGTCDTLDLEEEKRFLLDPRITNAKAISKCMPVIEIIKPTENNDIGDTNNDDDNNMENIYTSIEITATTENNDDISIEKLYPSIEITSMTENTVSEVGCGAMIKEVEDEIIGDDNGSVNEGCIPSAEGDILSEFDSDNTSNKGDFKNPQELGIQPVRKRKSMEGASPPGYKSKRQLF